MMFTFSDRAEHLQQQVKAFMDKHVYPNELEYKRQINECDRWQPVPIILSSYQAANRISFLFSASMPPALR